MAAEKAAKKEKPRLAVVDFKTLGEVGIKDAGRVVAELLRTHTLSKKYQMVERSRLLDILTEHKLTMADIVENPALSRGKLKGVRYLVVGSVVKLAKLTITARVVDVTTGDTKQTAKVSAEDARGLEKGVEEVARLLFAEAAKTLTLALGGGVTMELALIPAGKFLMGSGVSAENLARQYGGTKPSHFSGECPQCEVTITKPFYMGVTEVTQAQWQAVMGTEPGKGMPYVKEGGENAVSYVSWDDATAFCAKLLRKSGRTFRLPTEAEWEYACRAGSKTKFCFGDDASKLGDYAWYRKNAWEIGEKYVHPVARKKPNAWGLYDMHGNAWEWCADYHDKTYYSSATRKAVDPTGPASGTFRVLRGSSFVLAAWLCRSARRHADGPDFRVSANGFRVASPVPVPYRRP